MAKPKSPTPPDPNVTAGAQTANNVTTSLANTQLGQVNQITPQGSLTYEQTGSNSFTDPNTGNVYDLPQYTATTSLSPEAQAIHDQNMGAQMGLAETANQQAAFLKDYLGSAPNFDTGAIEGRIDELARYRLDPRFERERAATDQRLANQGITRGSAAWRAEMDQFNQSKNDAYNQLALTGRSQALGELATQRNQPINEISALLSGSQVSNPAVSMAQPSQIPTTNYAGIQNASFGQQMQAYQNDLENWQKGVSKLGSLFGVPGFAKGTKHAPGGLAVVGEDGPELVNLPKGSQVFANPSTPNPNNSFTGQDVDVADGAMDIYKFINQTPQYDLSGLVDANGQPIKLTGDQSKLIGFLRKAMFADAMLEDPDLANSMTSMTNNLAGNFGALGRLYTGDDYELGQLASETFSNAILRKESGAATPTDEIARYNARYFPRANETPEILNAKKALRREEIRALEMALGSAAPIGELIREEIEALRKGATSQSSDEEFLKSIGVE